MFPLEHLTKIKEMTHINLENAGYTTTTEGEIITFFGTLLRCARSKLVPEGFCGGQRVRRSTHQLQISDDSSQNIDLSVFKAA